MPLFFAALTALCFHLCWIIGWDRDISLLLVVQQQSAYFIDLTSCMNNWYPGRQFLHLNVCLHPCMHTPSCLLLYILHSCRVHLKVMCACVSHLYVKKNPKKQNKTKKYFLFALQGISADGLHYMERDVLPQLDIILGLCMFVSVGVSEVSCHHLCCFWLTCSNNIEVGWAGPPLTFSYNHIFLSSLFLLIWVYNAVLLLYSSFRFFPLLRGIVPHSLRYYDISWLFHKTNITDICLTLNFLTGYSNKMQASDLLPKMICNAWFLFV